MLQLCLVRYECSKCAGIIEAWVDIGQKYTFINFQVNDEHKFQLYSLLHS